MKNIVREYIQMFIKNRKKHLKFICVLLLLSSFVAGSVFWKLRFIGITLTDDTCYANTEASLSPAPDITDSAEVTPTPAPESSDDISAAPTPVITDSPEISPTPAPESSDDISSAPTPVITDSPEISPTLAPESSDDISSAPTPAPESSNDISAAPTPVITDSPEISPTLAPESGDAYTSKENSTGSESAHEPASAELSQETLDQKMTTVDGTKDFLYENDYFTINLHLTGSVKLPVAASDSVKVSPEPAEEKPQDADSVLETEEIEVSPELPAEIPQVADSGLETEEINASPELPVEIPQVADSGLETEEIEVSPELPAEIPQVADSGLEAEEMDASPELPAEIPQVADSGLEAEEIDASPELPVEIPQVADSGLETEEISPDSSVSKESQTAAPSFDDLSLNTTLLEEDDEESYTSLLSYLTESEDEEDLFLLTAMKFLFVYQGLEVDTSGCTLTADITPKSNVYLPPVRLYALANDLPDETFCDDDPTADSRQGVILSVYQEKEQEVTALDQMLIPLTENEVPSLRVSIENDGVLALTAKETANPAFTVQYYAYVNEVSDSGDNPLNVIDTTGGKLPRNGQSLNPKKLYLTKEGDYYKVKTLDNLMPIYTEKDYTYNKAPGLKYFNRLSNNAHYKLIQIWVLNDSATSEENSKTILDDWTIITYSDDIKFTNNQSSASDKTIYINDNSVLRLVYDTIDGYYNNAATFYDYDITDGKLYKSSDLYPDNIYSKQTDDITVYGYTKCQGINSSENYTGNGTCLAFGNDNTGTTLGKVAWNNQTLNKFNKENQNNYGGGCTFGIAKCLDANGHIVYSSGIVAPKLFDDGTAKGKTKFSNYSLDFSRVGDTYTLTSVSQDNGNKTQNLDKFDKLDDGYGIIYTNNFWPMDSAPTNGHDLRFGSKALQSNRKYFNMIDPCTEWSSFPISDDTLWDHNSYFGMQYAVNFTLTDDYTGPLEYYFFGDDDMWVFLDNKLICDIGGVHSSVGEYVNLWNHIKKGSSGTYKLSFFYTERGASGSTCYMRFTLPSVSSVTPEQKTADLHIEKEVAGPAETADEEFTFKLQLNAADNSTLKDKYTYVRYDSNSNNESIENGSLSNGDEFKLKDREYIILYNLPEGTKYTITEIVAEPDVYQTSYTINDGEGVNGRQANGTITTEEDNIVHYLNKTFYELPVTGGPGINLYTLLGLLLMTVPLIYSCCRLQHKKQHR